VQVIFFGGITDSGSCYKAGDFAKACKTLKLKHIGTKPYTPKTNGKAERFIQTAIRQWAYARAYQTSKQHAADLPLWTHLYNWHRPHSGIKDQTPISRLGLTEDNLLRLHTSSRSTLSVTSRIMSILNRLFRAGQRTNAKPAVPDGLRVYAIGDVHGRFDLLVELAEKIRADLADDPPEKSVEIYLGDYVDRGPDARSVIEWLRSRTCLCDERICLKGNHEEIFLQFIADPGIAEYWRDLGGFETLYSYGVQPPVARTGEAMLASHEQLMRVLPAEDVRFLQSLQLQTCFGDYLFVHAGLRPGVALEKQLEEDLIWIREPFLTSGHDFGKIVVHGHTPGDAPDIRANRINIDTGAFLTGCLTCLVLEGTGRRFIRSDAVAVNG